MEDYRMIYIADNLNRALETVRAVLSAEKEPCLADQVHHEYRDKYLLTECMTNAAVASVLNVLGSMGLTLAAIEQLKDWATHSAVSLKFRAEEHCTFERTTTRDVESKTKTKVEHSVGGVAVGSLTSAVVTTVTEHYYTLTVSYELLAVRGTGREEADRISIVQRSGRQEVMTTCESPPRPAARVPAYEGSVDVSWLFRHLRPQSAQPAFLIDRSHAKCHTPSRNPDVEAAARQLQELGAFFVASGTGYLMENFLWVQLHTNGNLNLPAMLEDSVFIPVMPLLDRSVESDAQADEGAAAAARPTPPAGMHLVADAVVPEGSALLGSTDINLLLMEEERTLMDSHRALRESFPEDESITAATDATLVVSMKHINDVCSRWLDGMAYVESMLRKQLIAAIGKQVSPADFAEYMRYHNAKLFRPDYAPAPWSYAVRRSSRHSPEGTVSIEQEVRGGDTAIPLPIETSVAKSTGPHPMTFKLGASTEVCFDGEKYLHAWIDHRFEGHAGSELALVARARQFCSMIVLVGRISSATRFDPSYAAIVQNKDELTIPLELSTIPTPKEFKDAIHSLSPEQQGFAKAFRSMQLEGTLFGVLVVQMKPQLERVLNLHPDCLTKEIKLTQDLTELFIKYQIPCDLLSFDASLASAGDDSAAGRLAAVRSNVEGIQSIIEEAQREEIEEAKRKAEQAEAARKVQEEANERRRQEEMLMRARLHAEEESLAPRMRCAMAAPPEACLMAAAPRACYAMAASPAPVMCAAASVTYAAPPPPQAPAPAPAPPPPQAPAPAPGQQPQTELEQPQDAGAAPPGVAGGAVDAEIRDYTQVPKQLDEQFERLDTDSALRPTKIQVGKSWRKVEKKSLLQGPSTRMLGPDAQKKEKDAAFDLLDALTKSGALPLSDATLHILVAATHCFDKSVTETVVQDNMNPIEKVERSILIMASTVHQQQADAMIDNGHQGRVRAASPALFLNDGA